MPVLKSLDTFIEQSQALLEARPETTRVTTTYTHSSKHQPRKTQETVSTGARPAVLFLKTYDPVSGTCYRIRVSKANELSRAMTALGPRGVTLTRAKPVNVKGLASTMANIEVEVASRESTPAPQPQAQPQQKKKKKGKK
ncbi:signal recognition particle subunit Srp21p [Trichomonascus vanleenenianus]|uniref:signal recognition particle subunit SRP21 n=1 Tax=Trichomonascus vanleenenianus TaxID=2268995 RepID=UPI003EC97F77